MGFGQTVNSNEKSYYSQSCDNKLMPGSLLPGMWILSVDYGDRTKHMSEPKAAKQRLTAKQAGLMNGFWTDCELYFKFDREQ